MKRLLLIISILWTFCNTCIAQTTSISGVVNSYHKILEIIPAKSCVRVENTTGLAGNDKVMLIQVKGALINTNNTYSFGEITSINNAGNYEISQICSIKGDSVFLSYTILNDYTPSGKVQLVRIPVYTDAVVTDSLKAAPWENTTGLGGVLAIEVEGTLTLDAPVSATGAGFKGGSFVKDNGDCSNLFPVTTYFANANFSTPQPGGFKGEGVYEITSINQSGGRGALANGGGGGNNHNNSGGGGANITAGGDGGGNSSTTGCEGDYKGLGGKALDANSGQRIFYGGGGGAGHANNTTVSTGGGNGGGIIFIKAGTIAGNNHKILSKGKVGGNTTGDGASGGGAAGTIIMHVTNYAGGLSVEANGGNGGNENNELILRRCYGGGGGGSGGVIYFNGASPVSNSVAGGSNGIITNSNTCPSLINGLPGNAGQIILNYTFTASTTLANTCSLVLPVDLISFNAKKNQNNTSLLWETGKIDDVENFEIEHSINGRDWRTLKIIEATVSQFYQWDHDNKSGGYHFYRLKIFDAYGTWDYSHVEKIYRDESKRFSVFPNPAKNNLFISGEFKLFSLITVSDFSGKIILTQKVLDHKTVQHVPINEIPPGVYLVKLENQVHKIVIH